MLELPCGEVVMLFIAAKSVSIRNLLIILIYSTVALTVLTGCVNKYENSLNEQLVSKTEIKAVYLAPKSGAQLSENELRKYPQIVVVNNFNDLKTSIDKANKKMGIWVDMSAVDLADKEWLLSSPQKFYPVLLIGCYDLMSQKPMSEAFYNGDIDWTSQTITAGFSYWILENNTYHEGIDTLNQIDEMFRVTDMLLSRQIK
ncbi:MAG: hypothetical protein SCK29_05640 [Bacillota bacterium]|nr:hypothetical protein [Bacillota bacterium]MDW7683587.1 hypothetical protein [Bacillota bacterium]